MKAKADNRLRRKKRIRGRLSGTQERPRLSVFRSAKHIYAQVVNDTDGKTLCAVSTLSKEVRAKGVNAEGAKKTEVAKQVGETLAKACLEKGIDSVVFDRNGFLYHGRIKALAMAAREAGLQF